MKKEPLNAEDIFKMHEEKFGFKPVITGINFFATDSIELRVLKAIKEGKPYIEEEVPEGALI